jgi:hypothetical protein
VELELARLGSGGHAVVLEVDDALLVRDNRHNMVLHAREKRTVLSIETPGGGRAGRASGFFLATALNASSASPYALTTAAPQRIESAPPAGSLLIWNSVPPSAAASRRLQDFVQGGGGLVVIAGDPAVGGAFNRSFGAWLPIEVASPAGGAARGNLRPGEDYVLLTDVRLDHAIFRPFAEPNSGSFSSARFYKHAPLVVKGGAQVLARFDNGDPALIEARVGKGKVLVFASSADDAANDLPLKAVYAPFWQQVFRHLDNVKEGRNAFEIGVAISPKEHLAEEGVRLGKTGLDLTQPIVVMDPSRQRVEASSSESVVLDRAGFYEIRTSSLSRPVAVNTLPRESDLAHGNSEEMIAGWAAAAPGTPTAMPEDERMSPEEQDSRQRLWKYLLLAALLVMLAEAVFANQPLKD